MLPVDCLAAIIGNYIPMRSFLRLLVIPLCMAVSPVQADHLVSLVVDVNRDIKTQVTPLQCIFGKLDEELHVVRMPWKRGQIATQAGDVDGFFMASQNEARDEYAVFSEPLSIVEWIYITRVNHPVNPNATKFLSQKFGSTHGAQRVMWLKEKMKSENVKPDIILMGSPAQTLSALNKNELDVVFSNRASYEQAIEALQLSEENFSVYTARKVQGGVYIAKTYLEQKPDFVERFNQAAKICES